MTRRNGNIVDWPEWRALEQHHAEIRVRHLRDWFDEDGQRGKQVDEGEAEGCRERGADVHYFTGS